MASVVNICSTALSLLGAQPISSTTESQQAILAASQYERARDEVLVDLAPACARFRAVLAQLAATPAWDYSYQFQLPTSPFCLSVLETDLDEGEPWRVESLADGSRVLLSHSSTVSIVYIGRVEDPNLYDALTQSAIEYRLAGRLAVPVTGQKTARESMLQEYAMLVKAGRPADARQHQPVIAQTRTLLAPRWE